jgi:ribose-phosphate pyrophosphokinase
MKLFAGNSNRVLAEAVARYLNIPLGKASVRRFADHGNLRRDPGERARRGCLHPPVDLFPTNDHLMELLIITDACAVPRPAHHGGDPLFRLCKAGSPRFGPHADLGQARRQHDHACRRRPRPDARPACRPDPGLLRHPDRQSVRCPGHGARHQGQVQELNNAMVVSPDVGGVVRARALAKRIDAQLAIVDKRRERPGESEVMNIIGSVEGKAPASSSTTSSIPAARCATPPTRCSPRAPPASTAYITHGVLSGGAVPRASPAPSSRNW